MPFFKSPFPSLPKVETPTVPGLDGAKEKFAGVLPTGGKPTARRELEELLFRVEVIEQDCIAEKKEDELAEVKDEFVRLKRSMYNDLADTKDMIRARHEIQQLRGNTVEAIQKGAKINEKLQVLDTDFLKIKEIFKKQTKQKKTIGEEELDKRFKDMQVMKRQIEECRALYRNGAQFSDDEIQTLTDFRAQMRAEGVELPKAEDRELMDVEKDALNRWSDRDAQIDQGLDEVGEVVGRLGELALNIGEKADKQAKIVGGLTEQANEANEELVEMNQKIKGILAKGSGINFFCKLALALVLVCQLGYLLSVMTNLITGD